MGCATKCCTMLVLFVAVAIGLVLSGALAEITPLMRYLDEGKVTGFDNLKGLVPAFHRGAPWGYTHEELSATDLTGQVILVTGGNIGLGFSTAKLLAKQNAEVVIACRSASKCEAAAKKIEKEMKKTVVPMVCDLGSFKSILGFVKAFKQKFKKLDSLILNAGLYTDFSLTEDGLETTIGVNHFGHFLMTMELLPLVQAGAKAAGVATIVSVSSALHWETYPEGVRGSIDALNEPEGYSKDFSYGQSKLANVLFAQELSERVKKDNILVNVIHPGVVRTQMQEKALATLEDDYGPTIHRIMNNLVESISWTADDAALTQIYTAVGKSLKEGKITGKYYHPVARLTPPSDQSQNMTLQKLVWDMTEDFVASRKKELNA